MNYEKSENFGLPPDIYKKLATAVGKDRFQQLKATLNKKEFDDIVRKDYWEANDLSTGHIEKLKGEWKFLRPNTFAIGVSGYPGQPKNLDGYDRCVAGFDVLVTEDKRKPGEPIGNAYHFVIIEFEGYYCLFQGDNNGARIEHWFGTLDGYIPLLDY